ncbi:MAG: TetR/AcrR family transcriptional regulator [Magnetococcus sp. WYHC-3]
MHTVRKNPVQTREALLEAAYEEMQRYGFQSASLSAILRRAGLTKGAMYHHFENKTALGYAVVEEVIPARFQRDVFVHLEDGEDFVTDLRRALENDLSVNGEELLRHGCPLNNLAQEMSPIDEGFRVRIDQVFTWAIGRFAAAIQRSQQAGTLRPQVEARSVALFILAAMEGCLSLAKNTHDREQLQRCGQALFDYLETLRPAKECP